MKLAKIVLVIGGTAVGLVGLGTVAFAKAFQWAETQYRTATRAN